MPDPERVDVSVPLEPAIVEWIELEVAEHDFDSVAHWIRTQVLVTLQEDLRMRHGGTVAVTVDVSEDFARRFECLAAARGDADPDDAANYVSLDFEWTADGEPWDLAGDEADG